MNTPPFYSQGVAHRDLKLENVLLSNATDDALVKVTDFGLAKLVGPQSFMKTMCGTPFYQAPEVLLANTSESGDVVSEESGNVVHNIAPLRLLQSPGYDKAVDMWSLVS